MSVERADADAEAPPGESKEASLWRAFKQEKSIKAREELFDMHLAFAKQIAIKHYLSRERGDIELPELRQLACVGLLEAIDRFDPAVGAPFRSYARRRVSGAILDGLSKASELRQQISFRNRVRSERIRSLSTPNAEDAPLADAMNALVNLAVGLAMGFMLEGTGLYVAEDEPDPHPDAYETIAWKEAMRRLTGEVEKLSERERAILQRHYVDGLDFQQIAKLLGVSKGRVSQVHRVALALLRRRLGPARGFRFEK